jgi:hypothetical protein
MSRDTPNTVPPAANVATDGFLQSVSQLRADDDDFSDFGNDPEELEIIEQLFSQVTSKQQDNASLIVTDIEDYEPPRGVRLPKVLGLEQTRQWESESNKIQIDGQAQNSEFTTPSPMLY